MMIPVETKRNQEIRTMTTYTTTLAARDTKGRIACNGFREYHRIDRKGKCVDCGYQHKA